MHVKSLGLKKVHYFELGATPPYSFELTVKKPAGWTWATPEEIHKDRTLWTAVRHRDRLLGLKLESFGTLMKPRIGCSVYSKEKMNGEEKSAVSRLVGKSLMTEEDIKPFYEMAMKDSILSGVVKDLRGMRIVRWPDLFPALILAITLQMAPLKRSSQMMRLLLENFGESAEFDHKIIRYWPSPSRIARTDEDELRKVAKLGYRATNLKAIAKSLLEGFPAMDELSEMTYEEAKKRLMELRGVGEYSADIVATERGFALDVWSAKIFHVLFKGKEPDDPRGEIPELQRIAQKRWGRWTGHAFVYVLNDLPRLSKRISIDLTKF